MVVNILVPHAKSTQLFQRATATFPFQSGKLRAAGQSHRDANQLWCKHFPTIGQQGKRFQQQLSITHYNLVSVHSGTKKSKLRVTGKKGGAKSLESAYRVEKGDGFHVPTLPSNPLNSKTEPAECSPLQYFLSLLFRDLDSQVPKRLHNLLGINTACKDKPVRSSTFVTS